MLRYTEKETVCEICGKKRTNMVVSRGQDWKVRVCNECVASHGGPADFEEVYDLGDVIVIK